MGKLDPAGVDLQAKGFREYLNKLERIEKQQRETFDKEFKGAGRSFEKVTRAARDYEQQLNRTRQAQDKLARANRLNRSLGQLESRQRRLGGGGGGIGGRLGGLAALGPAAGIAGAALALREAAQFVNTSSELAVAFEGQKAALDSLADSYGASSGRIRNSIREAAQGTLSETAILLTANAALQLDVARTGEDFGRLTRNALVLGKTFGIDATQAIERFTTALGRKSFQRLDDFGIKVEQVNAQIAILGQQEFGKAFEDLSAAEKDFLFIEAALRVADERVKIIGTDIIGAKGSADQLTASMENFSLVMGQVALPSVTAIKVEMAEILITATDIVAKLGAGFKGGGIADFFTLLGRTADDLPDFKNILDPGAFDTFFENLDKPLREIDPDLFQGTREELERLQQAGGLAPSEETEEAIKQLKKFEETAEDAAEQVNALQNALGQAERLQLSFARAAEDATRKLERQQTKLARTQARDRDKLLVRQQKDLDKFEASRLKDLENFDKDRVSKIAQAEKDIAKAREQAADDRLAAQKRLQLQLRQNAERFRLSQIQSERRFQLSDRRLRAEGDILALQELRENRALEVQEGQENFNLQQQQTKEGEKQISDDRIREQQERLQELKANLDQERKELEISLEEQRAELLAGFDEQLREQQIAQEEQRADLLRNFAEQQEDRRINQDRQLEDLGRSLQDQEDLTEAGAAAIAGELEKIFGIDGAADTIFQGFSSRTESEFRNLFDTVSNITRSIPLGLGRGRGSSPRGTGGSLDRPLQFQEGGIVPGPIGAPQAAIVHGGEGVFTAREMQSQTMAAPVISSQRVSVDMSGGFNISGGEQAGEIAVQAALDEMTTSFEIAVRRLIRRG